MLLEAFGMYNYFLSFRNAFINRFGLLLGYPLMVICMFVTLSVIIFLLRFFFSIAMGLLFAGLILFGFYKLRQIINMK
jgi:hypothetical protein